MLVFQMGIHYLRGSHGLTVDDPEAKAGIICDAWAGSFSTSHGEHHRREAFYKTHRVMGPFKFSGGWSAHGQPVDQLHAVFRKRLRSCDVTSLGMVGNLRERARFLLTHLSQHSSLHL